MCSDSITASTPTSSASWAIRTRPRRSRAEAIVQFSLRTITSLGGVMTESEARRSPIHGEDACVGGHLEGAALLDLLARGHALIDDNKRLALAATPRSSGSTGTS